MYYIILFKKKKIFISYKILCKYFIDNTIYTNQIDEKKMIVSIEY